MFQKVLPGIVQEVSWVTFYFGDLQRKSYLAALLLIILRVTCMEGHIMHIL